MTIIEKNEPVKILIEARYIGRCLHRARIRSSISRKDLAKRLGLKDRELLQIECGRAVIPKENLIELLRKGIA